VVPHEPFEPGFAREVEMVVRLVEEEHVRLLDQQPRQPDQLLLAAAELPDRLIGARLRKPESVKDLSALRGLPVAVEPLQDDRVGIHDGRQLVVAIGPSHHLFELTRPRLQHGGIAHGESDRLAYRLAGIECGLLAEKSDPGSARQGETPALRSKLPGHQPEEGALARPIGADERQAVPLANLEGGAAEHIISAIGVFDMSGLDQQGHERSILALCGVDVAWRTARATTPHRVTHLTGSHRRSTQ
jgi:hypothetical protein